MQVPCDSRQRRALATCRLEDDTPLLDDGIDEPGPAMSPPARNPRFRAPSRRTSSIPVPRPTCGPDLSALRRPSSDLATTPRQA